VIVLDASAVVELLLHGPRGRTVAARVAAENNSFHTAHLMAVEVASALRRKAAAGEISDERGATAIQRLAVLPAARHEHELLLPRIWRLRANLSTYDAVYVALAEALGATLLTTDTRLGRAPGHTARVEVLA
jgi:predicted nucleic acid-binding protein